MGEPSEASATTRRGMEHVVIVLAAAAAWLGLALMRWLLTPAACGFGTHEQLGLPPCRSIDWFGIPCPGCGVTTSVTWFAHGELWQSLVVQPFGFALGALALCGFPLALIATLLGRDLGYDLRLLRLSRWWIPSIVFVLAAWIYKIVLICW